MKILLPVDGSDCSARAAEYLADHTTLFKEVPEIVLLNVHAPIASSRVRSYVGSEALERYYAEESEAALSGARAILDRRQIAYTAMKMVGNVAETIARTALEQGCTLIAMGTHGHGNIGNLVMGSTATKVIAEAKLPVLLIK